MRLSREKINKLSHVIISQFVASDDVEFIEDRETIRQEVLQILNTLLKDEEKMDAEVRKKISSQKKSIPEGSKEWDILYDKYYADELKKLGVQEKA